MSPYRPEAINGSVAASSTRMDDPRRSAGCNAGAGAISAEARSDARQSDIVASGIAMLPGGGVMMAFEYLKLHAIGAHVIERVLLEPQRRRA